jgi:hypothetical protein
MSANGFDSAGTVACGKQWSVTALLVVPNDSDWLDFLFKDSKQTVEIFENLATWQPLPNPFPLCPKLLQVQNCSPRLPQATSPQSNVKTFEENYQS